MLSVTPLSLAHHVPIAPRERPNLACTSTQEVGLLRPLAMFLAVAFVWLGAAVHVSAEPRTEIFYGTGTKALRKDCTVTAKEGGHTGGVALFDVKEGGPGCGNYLIRAASLTTEAGHHAAVESWQDQVDDPRIEELEVSGDALDDSFLYGDLVVYAPYRSRCDRYRFAVDGGGPKGSVRYLDSWPCSGSPFPSDVKGFRQPCGVVMDNGLGAGPSRYFVAREVGAECGAYVLRGVSEVLTSGARAFSDRDDDHDPGLEAMSVSLQPRGTSTDMAYGTIDVYIPALSRCDRYR